MEQYKIKVPYPGDPYKELTIYGTPIISIIEPTLKWVGLLWYNNTELKIYLGSTIGWLSFQSQDTTYTAGSGLTLTPENVFNHTDTINAITVSALYPIKLNSTGHIIEYGAGIEIGTNTETFLRNDGTWQAPNYKTYTLNLISNAVNNVIRLSDGVTNSDINIVASSNIQINPQENALSISATDTTYSANGGIQLDNSTHVFSHTNNITPITTSNIYKIKVDAYGHINEVGDALELPQFPLSVNNGGTGLTILTQDYFLSGNGTNSISLVNPTDMCTIINALPSNNNLIPLTTNLYDIGSVTDTWKSLYLNSLYIYTDINENLIFDLKNTSSELFIHTGDNSKYLYRMGTSDTDIFTILDSNNYKTYTIGLDGGSLTDSLIFSGTFNRGGWGAPTTGAITQIIDDSTSQHSILVGRVADGTRYYGMDFFDSSTSPKIRLYCGTGYTEFNNDGIYTPGTLGIEGKATLHGSMDTTYIELSSDTPYIDFHYGNNTSDFTHRIIALDGKLSIYPNLTPFGDNSQWLGTTTNRWYTLQVGTGGINTDGAIISNTPKSLGTSAYPWDTVYANTGTIQSSDRRRKENIQEIQNGEDLILSIEPVEFTFVGGKRIHYGFIAQDIKTAMTDSGIQDAALYVRGTKNSTDDPNTAPEEDVVYGLRYEEFIAPMVKVIQTQQKQIESLINEVNDLKNKLVNNV